MTEAVRIGAYALSVTGQAQEARAFDQMLKDLGDRTTEATHKAAELTGQVVIDATETVTRAAAEAKRAIIETDERSRKELTNAIATAKTDLNTELRRIFGGENPELLERLHPILDKFGADLDGKLRTGTTELLAKAARQFDPSDPTSPMAKHTAELNSRHDKLIQQFEQRHNEVVGKIDQLSTAPKIQDAQATLANVTPLKGDTYASQIHALMECIATGLGDDYADTGAMVGKLPRCMKGDGLLTIDSGVARLVLEMTDSKARSGWSDYLDQAERNRGAAASLGLVPTPAQNGGQSIKVVGSRRIIIAFNPATDDPDLLRTVVLLLRTAAIAAVSRTGASEVATAEEKISEAIAQLARIDTIKKLAGTIQKNATKVDSECATLNSGIRRLLDQALGALAGAHGHPALPELLPRQDGAA